MGVHGFFFPRDGPTLRQAARLNERPGGGGRRQMTRIGGLKVDRPQLSPEDIKKLEAAMKEKAKPD